MQASRRSFLKQLAAGVSALFGAMQLSGCLGESGDSQFAASEVAPQSSWTAESNPAGPTAPVSQGAPSATVDAPTQQALNQGPVWEPAATIEFVEGVPAVISVRQFVRDPDQDPLVISLKSGALIPGVTWDPVNATIAYDGRALGATDDVPIVVPAVVFSADDRRS